MKVFLSVGATYTRQQEKFVAAFETFLVQNECVRLTVGRGNEPIRQPILEARDLMQAADAVVVLAFTRTIVRDAVEKPDAKDESTIRDTRYPTVWNQLEAAMAFGLDLPLLVIIEKGLHQEAMLKDRHEFRTLTTELSPDYFRTDEFKGMFAKFRGIALGRTTKTPAKSAAPPDVAKFFETATVIEILRVFRPAQLVGMGSAVLGIAAASAWAARHFP
jgi:hypothetical protein